MVDLELGATIDGRFKLDRFLGEGGMGAVWAAHHIVTGKLVALKILKGGGDEHRRRFVQEARVAAAIRHPNVVDIHDVVELSDGRPVLVMDLLEGEPLSSMLARIEKFEPIALAKIMLPVLAGVGAAHAVGIVHRDLKPENVFLARGEAGQPMVKVLDFGIAKLTALSSAIRHTAALTQTGSVLGTPMYMAPEQVFGEKGIDHRADIWSLGVVMYECLTGTCPIQGENVGQIFKSISQRTFPPLRERLPSLPSGVTELVDDMLSVNPEERPESARLVAERLAFHTRLETPKIDEPRWLPGSHRRPSGADPTAPTEAHRAIKRGVWWLRPKALVVASASIAAMIGWKLTTGVTAMEAKASAAIDAQAPTQEASVAARPSASIAVASMTAPLADSATQPKASATASTVVRARARPSSSARTSAGPGGIHEASPY